LIGDSQNVESINEAALREIIELFPSVIEKVKMGNHENVLLEFFRQMQGDRFSLRVHNMVFLFWQEVV